MGPELWERLYCLLVRSHKLVRQAGISLPLSPTWAVGQRKASSTQGRL